MKERSWIPRNKREEMSARRILSSQKRGGMMEGDGWIERRTSLLADQEKRKAHATVKRWWSPATSRRRDGVITEMGRPRVPGGAADPSLPLHSQSLPPSNANNQEPRNTYSNAAECYRQQGNRREGGEVEGQKYSLSMSHLPINYGNPWMEMREGGSVSVWPESTQNCEQ
jgi:hypothetical protein